MNLFGIGSEKIQGKFKFKEIYIYRSMDFDNEIGKNDIEIIN